MHAFHAKHFASAPQPSILLNGTEAAAPGERYEEKEPAVSEEFYEEGEDLGYYPDGAERTLTDEQIAMFRHSEIQRIIRERRRRRDDGEPIEQLTAGTSGHSHASAQADDNPDAPVDGDTQAKPAAGDVSRASQSGGVEKPSNPQWATSSARTKARNKRNRNKYKAKKRDARLKKEQAWKDKDDEESDEWDPWHQAKGPDVQQDDTVDLDY